ncbi:alpha/beta fold hydrolase [Pseudonocardia sp. TRM90224]|uniref:alpha/beta fold hydrolase n=1 Tax=Pseudonocardia sp. TRM90224 TaxID=2812678 RepID=UPI001E57DF31|nr:alpha/beta hydrolase [Pseudonocardia sp. TRM90224]
MSDPEPIRMHVHEWGSGPRMVLVHGGVLGGREAWRAQRPLTERWTLLAPDRPGHGRTPRSRRQDFEADAQLVADQLLDEPSHLVGLSYGAIVAMYAAALRPAGVRSLTIAEPPSSGVVKDVPAVAEWGAQVRSIFENTDVPPADALRRFFPIAGTPVEVPDPLPEPLERGMRQLFGARPPDEADPPLHVLRDAPFPVLVVSGGHSDVQEMICDVIAKETGAERAVCAGMGHLIPDTGEPFNTLIEQFALRADRTA